MVAYYCGIDLGTTNSTISVIDISRRSDDPIEKLTTIPIYQYNKNLMQLIKERHCSHPSFIFK